jgi:hypothetical protein
LASLGQQRHPEYWYAHPVSLSACGRYLAFSLTEKALRGVSRRASLDARPEKVYVYQHALCVLDLETKTHWSRHGYAKHLRWLS